MKLIDDHKKQVEKIKEEASQEIKKKEEEIRAFRIQLEKSEDAREKLQDKV